MSDTPTPQQAPVPPPLPDGAGRRVLIVDGSELGSLLQGLLLRHKIDAVLARTAGQALDAILQRPVDLAIVELDLPDASGVDLMHIVRQQGQVPVVIIGALPRAALPQHMQQGVDLADHFFQKPLHSQELLNVVSELLGMDRLSSFTPPRGVPIPEDTEGLDEVTAELVVPSAPPASLADAPSSTPDETSFYTVLGEVSSPSLPPLPPQGPPRRPPPLPLDALLTDPDHTRIPQAHAPHQFTQIEPGSDVVDDVPISDNVSSLPQPVVETAQDPTDLMAMWMRKREAAQRSQPPPLPQQRPQAATQGELASTDLARLLDAYYSASESGTLLLKRAQGMRRIAVLEGQVVTATSNVGGEQVTDVLNAMALLTPERIDQALQQTGGKRHEVLGLLVREGVLPREVAQRVLVEQRRRILEGAFHWHDGEYELQPGRPPKTALEPIFTGEVILRGILASARPEDLQQRILPTHRYAPRGDGPYPLERLTLSTDEARLIIACDGTKTVKDLQTISDLDNAHVLGLILGLSVLRLVRLLPEAPANKRVVTFF